MNLNDHYGFIKLNRQVEINKPGSDQTSKLLTKLMLARDELKRRGIQPKGVSHAPSKN